jgi:hypothetical protein
MAGDGTVTSGLAAFADRSMAEEISEIVKRLIAESIDSIPEVEAILLLRDHPSRDWTADDAGQRLYVSRPVAAHVLSMLAERGFFLRTGETYRYGPANDAMRTAVDELAAAYSQRLIDVTQLVHSKPGASVRSFAEAFRLRRDK